MFKDSSLREEPESNLNESQNTGKANISEAATSIAKQFAVRLPEDDSKLSFFHITSRKDRRRRRAERNRESEREGPGTEKQEKD